MKPLLFSALLLGLAAAVPAQAAPDLAATVHYQTRQLTPDGVSRQNEYQERFLRKGQNAWSRRLLPANTPVVASHGEAGHEHETDLTLAGRWVEQGADGKLRVRYVAERERAVIEALPGDWSAVGFDESWDEVYYLLPPAVLAGMHKLKTDTAAGTTLYERRAQGAFERVLWSEKLELPLSIESGRDDGTAWSQVTVTPEALPKTLPWQDLSGYAQKEYTDLLD